MPLLIQDAITIFLGIIIEATPFILLGVLVSAIIKIFISPEKLLTMIPKNRFGAAAIGSVIGFIFPVCECGNIPVARQLIRKGIAPYVAISFLLAAPVFNPIVILATIAAFPNEPRIVLLRIVLSIAIAITVGILFSFCKRKEEIIKPESSPTQTHHHNEKGISGFANTLTTEFFEMGGVMVIGGLLAAFSQVLIPRNIIVGIADGPVSAILAMMFLAVVVSICSNVDAFFALAYAPTFSSSALLAFLVFGPMIDIKAVLMLHTVFTKKAILWIGVLTFLLTLLSTLFLQLNIS